MSQSVLPELETLLLECQREKHTKMTILDVLSQYPICDRFLSYLEIVDLLNAQLISKRLTSNIKAHCQKRWNINRRLKRFVAHPKAFRTQLGNSDAVISGSFALQFLDDIFWSESGLDLYIQDGKGVVDLQIHLLEKEGYRQVEEKVPEAEDCLDVQKTTTYLRTHDGEDTRIYLAITRGPPIYGILNTCWTTALINIITWNQAYAIFPASTFLRRKAFMTREWLELNYSYAKEDGSLIKKYADRGWNFPDRNNRVRIQDWTEPLGEPRWVGDRRCWTLDLNIEGVEPTDPAPKYVMRGSHFCASNVSAMDGGGLLVIDCAKFSSPVLKYTYTSPTTFRKRDWDFWWKFKVKELDALIRHEVLQEGGKMGPEGEEKLAETAEGLSRIEEWDLEGGWNHYDHLVSGWLDQWATQVRKGQVKQAMNENGYPWHLVWIAEPLDNTTEKLK